ncbi:MAG: TIM barrel protein [Desulfurococcaceae archaeon]
MVGGSAGPARALALSTMLVRRVSPARAIEALAPLGLPLELSFDNFIFNGAPETEAELLAEALSTARELSAKVLVVHLPYDRLAPADAFSDLSSGRYDRWLAAATSLGAVYVVVHTLDVGDGDDRALSVNARFLAELSKKSADLGLRLAVENRLERKLFGWRPEHLEDLLDAVPGLAACLDVGHANVNGVLREFLEGLGARINVLHIHDNSGRFDEHRPPYTGTVDWELLERWIAGRFVGVGVMEIACEDVPGKCVDVARATASSRVASLLAGRYYY